MKLLVAMGPGRGTLGEIVGKSRPVHGMVWESFGHWPWEMIGLPWGFGEIIGSLAQNGMKRAHPLRRRDHGFSELGGRRPPLPEPLEFC